MTRCSILTSLKLVNIGSLQLRNWALNHVFQIHLFEHRIFFLAHQIGAARAFAVLGTVSSDRFCERSLSEQQVRLNLK